MEIFVIEVMSYNSDLNVDTQAFVAYHTEGEAKQAIQLLEDEDAVTDDSYGYNIRTITLHERKSK